MMLPCIVRSEARDLRFSMDFLSIVFLRFSFGVATTGSSELGTVVTSDAVATVVEMDEMVSLGHSPNAIGSAGLRAWLLFWGYWVNAWGTQRRMHCRCNYPQSLFDRKMHCNIMLKSN